MWGPTSRHCCSVAAPPHAHAAPRSQHKGSQFPQSKRRKAALKHPGHPPGAGKGSGMGQRELFPPLRQPKGRATGSGLDSARRSPRDGRGGGFSQKRSPEAMLKGSPFIPGTNWDVREGKGNAANCPDPGHPTEGSGGHTGAAQRRKAMEIPQHVPVFLPSALGHGQCWGTGPGGPVVPCSPPSSWALPPGWGSFAPWKTSLWSIRAGLGEAGAPGLCARPCPAPCLSFPFHSPLTAASLGQGPMQRLCRREGEGSP